ncbi:hypothetical protein F0562_015540 [Nyssa sinensis]|uniref:Uncharacterized protein n=1 Tax=Nyssa sinensis TaxID=561372 RepID=A0A5J4ZHI4_9ASTE|nr:hypothetical protein F0562_015540 [Nyssa sinensis]
MSELKNVEVPMDEVPVEELNTSHGDWVKSIMNVQGSNIAEADQSQTKNPRRIPRVPLMLRDAKDFEKYYTPRLVSIGPYHYKVRPESHHCYQNRKLQQVQKLKPKMANKFVSNDRLQLEGLYEKLLQKTKEVRECYEENSTKDFSDEALARMMLMDGCFILYYIKSVVEKTVNELELKSYHEAFLQQDLFLLENQLPFLVLDVLMSNSKKPIKEEWMTKINQFVEHNTMTPPQKEKSAGKSFGRCRQYCHGATGNKNREDEEVSKDGHKEAPPPAHLLELLHVKLVGDIEPINYCRDPQNYTFRKVKELTEVGIHLMQSEASLLTKINYEPHYTFGFLKLPPITVDDSTKAKFLNLIAYEMCPQIRNEFQWVTSYVCFLDSLIDNAEDVKELRSAKILHNCLGSDDEVAKLFNEIGTDLVPHPCAYAFVKRDIQEHYENKGKTYMAQLKYQYFKNPWTIFALLGAILALFFSAIQAFFQC